MEHDADALAAAGSATPHEKSVLDDAVEFLKDELNDGPMWAKQVFKDAKDAGVAEITLRRAKTALRVKSERIGIEGWQWELPSKEEGQQLQSGGSQGDHLKLDDHNDDEDHLDHLQTNGISPAEFSSYLTEDNHGDQGAQHDQVGEEDDVDRGRRRLTVEEAHLVQKLIAEGMEPAIARAEVTGANLGSEEF